MDEIVAYYQPLSGHVRAYKGGTPDNMDRFISAASVLWHDQHTAEFIGMFGEHMDKHSVAAHVKCLFDKGATVLTAKRVNPHGMPRGWQKISTHSVYSEWAIKRNPDAIFSGNKTGATMALQVAMNSKNKAREITEIENEQGEFLLRVTREYGSALPNGEAIEIEDEFNNIVKKYLPGQ